MNRISKYALATTLGLCMTAAAIAQTPPAPPQKRERPSPEVMQRMQDGRIAMITGALKMTPDQLKLWAPVEAKMREAQAERAKRWQSMQEQRQAAGGKRPDTVERMERMNQMMADRIERQKAFLGVFKPFHASLTDEQKQVVGPLLAQAQGGGRGGHGKRGGFAMHHRGPGPQ